MPRSKSIKRSTKLVLVAILASMLAAVVFFYQKAHAPSSNQNTVTSSNYSQPTLSKKQDFNKDLYSIDQSSSLWVVVNKGRVLPADYVPTGLVVPAIPLRLDSSAAEMHLRSDAAAALEKMTQDAKAEGVGLMLASGYRSYMTQKALYASYASTQGQVEADKTSAHAGHSEHQTGLAADLEPTDRSCEVEECFADTAAGKWLAANSARYGFVIRYQKDKVAQTGYAYEPWHVRYVGIDLAKQLGAQATTLEEFFGLPYFNYYPVTPFFLK